MFLWVRGGVFRGFLNLTKPPGFSFCRSTDTHTLHRHPTTNDTQTHSHLEAVERTARVGGQTGGHHRHRQSPRVGRVPAGAPLKDDRHGGSVKQPPQKGHHHVKQGIERARRGQCVAPACGHPIWLGRSGQSAVCRHCDSLCSMWLPARRERAWAWGWRKGGTGGSHTKRPILSEPARC